MPPKSSKMVKDAAYWSRFANKPAKVVVSIDGNARSHIRKVTRAQVMLAGATTIPVRAVKAPPKGLASRPVKKPLEARHPHDLGDLTETRYMGYVTTENVGARQNLIPNTRVAQEPKRNEAQVQAGVALVERGLLDVGAGEPLGWFCPLNYTNEAAARMSRGEKCVWDETPAQRVREWIDGAERTHKPPARGKARASRADLEALRLVMSSSHG